MLLKDLSSLLSVLIFGDFRAADLSKLLECGPRAIALSAIAQTFYVAFKEDDMNFRESLCLLNVTLVSLLWDAALKCVVTEINC